MKFDWDQILPLARQMREQKPTAKVKQRMYSREYYERTREQQLEKQRAYREAYREEIRARQREYDAKRTDRAAQAEAKRLKYHSDPEYRARVLGETARVPREHDSRTERAHSAGETRIRAHSR